MLWIAIVVLVVLGIWYFTRAPAEQPPAPVVEEPGVEMKDLVAINFVLAMTNSSVVDTNNESLAKEYGIGDYVKGPFRFIVGQSSKLKGFDEAIVGMKLGETRTKVIEPSEAVMQVVINRTRSVMRNQPFPRYSPMAIKKFEERFKRKPVINDVVVHPELPWPIKVINMTDRNVLVEALAEEGRSYQLPGFEWKSLVLVKSKNDMLVRHNPSEGQVITTEFGPAVVGLETGRMLLTYQAKQGDIIQHYTPIEGLMSIPYAFEVIESADTSFTIKRINHPAQEALVLTAELLEWEADVEKKS